MKGGRDFVDSGRIINQLDHGVEPEKFIVKSGIFEKVI